MSGKNASNASDGRDEKKDRLKARIALAVQERISPGECPSAEELAAFADGKLDEKEREEILAHLNACPDCHEDWLTATSELERDRKESQVIDFDIAAAGVKGKRRSGAGFSGMKHKMQELFFHLPRYVTSGIGLALAASLILVVWWGTRSPQSQMGTLIARSYTDMEARHGRIDTQALTLPWEGADSSYGFSSSSPPSEASVAFAAGLWIGREQLTGNLSPLALPESLRPSSRKESASPALWVDSQYSHYYWVGQWVILLKAACISDNVPDASFWEHQKKTLEKGLALFSQENTNEAKFLTDALKGIGPLIGELGVNPSDRRACSNLRTEIEALEKRLAPQTGE
jgi:hypothetical protein